MRLSIKFLSPDQPGSPANHPRKHFCGSLWQRGLGLGLAAALAACRLNPPSPTPDPTAAPRPPFTLAEIAGLGTHVDFAAIGSGNAATGAWLAVSTNQGVTAWHIAQQTATQRDTLSFQTLTELTPDTQLEQWDQVHVSLAFSPEGTRLAIGAIPNLCTANITPCRHGAIYQWDLSNNRRSAPWITTEYDQGGSPGRLQFSSDGKTLLFAFNLDGGSMPRSQSHVTLWDTQAARQLAMFTEFGCNRSILPVLRPDGQQVAIGIGTGPCNGNKVAQTVLLTPELNIESASLTHTWPYSSAVSSQPVFCPDSRCLIASVKSANLYGEPNPGTLVSVYALQTLQEKNRFLLQEIFIESLAIDPTGRILLAGDSAGRLHCFDLNTGAELMRPFQIDPTGLRLLALSPEGRLLVTVSESGTARLWAINLPSS